jgi:predicted PurR-regulated permease PerM
MSADLYRKLFLAATAALALIALYLILRPFFGALAWGGFLAFLLAPVQARLTRRWGGRAGRAAGVLTALTPLVLLAPLTTLAVVFANQVSLLLERLNDRSLRFDAALLERVQQLPVLGPALAWIRANVAISAEQIHEWAVGAAQSMLRSFASVSGNLVLGALGTVVSFFLMLFLLFFLLRDGPAMVQRTMRIIPLDPLRRDALLQLVTNTTRAVVYGTGATTLVQGALVGIGFAIAGLPSAVVFGVIAAILSLLPAGGTAFVWIPAALWLLVSGQIGWGIFMLAWGAGVSVSDNLLRPLLISSYAPISTLVVFVGVIGGVSAFGGIGLIIGPVLLALIAALFRVFEETYAKPD